ncbi:MAG TPA: hypothetical protein VEX66_02335 [Microlunatus sp.]|nr:hypothetical protein [Microlunatus sp.]
MPAIHPDNQNSGRSSPNGPSLCAGGPLADDERMQAVQPYATQTNLDRPLYAARRVAALAVDAFPVTILPNPLITELTTLYATGDNSLPLTEELAADIFMGRFSDKFRSAAQVAGAELRGSLYARYYGIDYDEVLALSPLRGANPWAGGSSAG